MDYLRALVAVALVLLLYPLLVGCGANSPPAVEVTRPQTDAVLFVDNPIDFEASASDPEGTVESYAWEFGDGSTGSGPNPTHAYDVAGEYTVTLTVTDEEAASTTVQRTLLIREPVPLEAMNSCLRDLVTDRIDSGEEVSDVALALFLADLYKLPDQYVLDELLPDQTFTEQRLEETAATAARVKGYFHEMKLSLQEGIVNDTAPERSIERIFAALGIDTLEQLEELSTEQYIIRLCGPGAIEQHD